jgi:CRP/FNR family transcriptional regulator, cyclic AMP receptor protein
MDEPERVKLLSSVPLFQSLRTEALELVAAIADEESYRTGTKIFSYGDVGNKLYIIAKGRVRISREVPGMGEEAIAILSKNAVFGEMALLDDTPRSADARVHERCELLSIEREVFDDLLFLHKDLAFDVLWSTVRILATRLRETNDKLTMLSASAKF